MPGTVDQRAEGVRNLGRNPLWKGDIIQGPGGKRRYIVGSTLNKESTGRKKKKKKKKNIPKWRAPYGLMNVIPNQETVHTSKGSET